jgi:L-ribulose-5-phosphate 3-epimerase
MRVGIVHNILGAEGLGASFEGAAKVGAEGVEVAYTDGKTLRRGGHAKELSELAEKHGVEIPSLSLGFLAHRPSLFGPPTVRTRAQRAISKGLTVAAEIGAKVILVPCMGKNAIETEAELTRAGETLRELIDEAEGAGVVIGIESNLNFSRQRFLLNYLGNTGYAKIYYDTGNALARKLDVASGIRDLGAEGIAQVHFKDIRLSEGEPPDYNVPLGKGIVDFRTVVLALRAIGYEGWIILETSPGEDPLTSARTNLTFIREILTA